MTAMLYIVWPLVVGLVGAHVNHRGICPQLNTTMTDFEPAKFLGEWFVIRSFDPDSSCLRFNYSSCGTGCLRVHEKKQLSIISTLGMSNVYQTVGKLRSAPDEPALMNATFTDNPRVAEYAVLDTDYDSFAVLFTCENISVGALSLYHRRDVYLLSRQRNGTFSLDQLERVSQTVIANQIRDEFEPVRQTGCISSQQAFLNLDTNRGIGERVQGAVQYASNAITGGLNSIASSITGLFSGLRRQVNSRL